MSQIDFSSAATFLEDPALMEPFTHVANLPSKNIRGYFVDAIAKHLLQLPERQVNKLQEATAILHSASLLFDDIEDGTLMRRGEPAAHVIFGMPLSLNAASAATCAALEVMLKDEDDDDARKKNKYFCSDLEKIEEEGDDERKSSSSSNFGVDADGESISPNKTEKLQQQQNIRQQSQIANNFAVSSSFSTRQLQSSPEKSKSHEQQELIQLQEELKRAALQGRLTRVYIDNMKLLHSGQGKDIYWRDIHQCPTLAEYRLMARQKTGGLFRLVAMWALELENNNNSLSSTSSFSKRNTLLLSLCDDFGLCFQILDDVANLCDETLHSMKTFADDLDEGKFSYPAIHCIFAGEKKTPQKDKRLLHALCRKNINNNSDDEQHLQRHLHQMTNSKKSIAEKEFCLNLMKEAGSIKASCDEVLSLCELLKVKTNEIISLNHQQDHDDNNEKCRKILLALVMKMSERAHKFATF